MTKASKKTPSTPATSGEPQAFQAEVAKLLQLMVHSVYSDRDVFLRELISNASDALDKLRYEAIATPALLEQEPGLEIVIAADKEAGTLTVSDTGIGMTADELASNLGTIARSGTEAYMASAKDAPSLIGQFGVGFYAAFMVAGKVEVFSRKAGASEAHVWVSDGLGTYTVSSAGARPRGTSIILHLKPDCRDYLEDWKLEQVVKAYSDHIAHPIQLATDKDNRRQINSGSAIWMRSKNDVTPDQHKEFFTSLSMGGGDPALTIHYRAEGRQEYNVLLYIPGEKPFDLYDPERKGRQKLYVRRVFIADDAALLPPYLRFIRGVIDSADMPLNLSREMLQNNPDVASIRKAVTNRVLSELKKCAEQDNATFSRIWNEFAPVIKEGLYEDMERRDQLFDIARFRSTKAESLTLRDYVNGLKENQTAIYYLTAEDAAKAAASPQLEGYKARDIEVLLLTDPVDSFWVRTALGFDGKPFTSVTQGAADLDKIKPAGAKDEEAPPDAASATLMAALKQALGDKVKDVRASKRLTDSAVCLVNDGYMDRTMERLLSRQKDSGVNLSAPVLEINAGHALIRQLAARVAAKGAESVSDAAFLLLDQAMILEGEQVSDPAAFARRLADVMQRAVA
ncbi:MAG: molecular chaperone HtpG [Proteobacteria bacterium]|nr:molecular chaperone HtpG [Pseudomonadota bacterium]